MRTDQTLLFHVINVFGSCGIGCKLVSGSAQMSSPRFARFREDSNLVSCANFHRNPRRTNSAQRITCFIRVFLQHHPVCRRMTPLSMPDFLSFNQDASSLLIASCVQLPKVEHHHRRLLLLEFLTIWPHVSDHSGAEI